MEKCSHQDSDCSHKIVALKNMAGDHDADYKTALDEEGSYITSNNIKEVLQAFELLRLEENDSQECNSQP